MLLDREPLEDLVEHLEDEDLSSIDPADFDDEDWEGLLFGDWDRDEVLEPEDWNYIMFGPMD